MKRIKLTHPVITSRAAAESLAGELASLILQQRQAETELDTGITSLRKQFEGRLSALSKSIGEKSSVLQTWAEANPSEFAGKKSLDMTHALVGWRTGQPQLKTLAGWTWDRVLEKLASLVPYKGFIRTKSEVDKAMILAARNELLPDDLRNMGVRVVQDEAFFIEPKLADQDATIKAAA
jgi:phage host-nuclease inhibitor protein Gam